MNTNKLNPDYRVPNRRRFLKRAACGVSALALASVEGGMAGGIEPIMRNKPARFKFSLAAYSYRGLLKGDNPPLTLFDFVDDCADFGLEATELTSYYFPEPLNDDYLRELKRHCFRLGLDVSGTAVGNDFGHPPGAERDAQISSVKRWIQRAEILGAPVIRIFAGHAKEGVSPDESHNLMVQGMQECCEFAGRHGVHLALENHGGPTSTLDGMLSLVRDVDSPWFGVNLDTGNFHTDDIYGDLARIAPYALNVQVKVTVSGPDGTKHPTEYRRLAQILRDVKYRGYVVLEYEEGGDPRQESRIHLDKLREAFA